MANPMKIFEISFIDSYKFCQITKNTLYLKNNQRFSDNYRHIFNSGWMDLYD
jgi:hypothetical protein